MYLPIKQHILDLLYYVETAYALMFALTFALSVPPVKIAFFFCPNLGL